MFRVEQPEIFVPATKMSKKKLKNYHPGKTKLVIRFGGESEPEKVIRKVYLIAAPLDESHGKEHAAKVMKFWTSPKSSIPDFMFKIVVDPIKKRKSKSSKSH